MLTTFEPWFKILATVLGSSSEECPVCGKLETGYVIYTNSKYIYISNMVMDLASRKLLSK
jgi:hypothetical protein